MSTLDLKALERDCKICGHAWLIKLPKEPERCPNCHNKNWQIGRTRKPRTKRPTGPVGGEL